MRCARECGRPATRRAVYAGGGLVAMLCRDDAIHEIELGTVVEVRPVRPRPAEDLADDAVVHQLHRPAN